MAIAISLLTSGIEPTTNPSTTDAVNPTAGSVTYLFIAYAVEGGGTAINSDTVTPTGARGTWTQDEKIADDTDGSGRRGSTLWIGTGTVTNEAITITATMTGTWTETAWIVVEVTGADGTTPNDTPQKVSNTGTSATLPSLGTAGASDAVLWAVHHEEGDESVTATGWTAVGAVVGTNASNDIRTLHGFYDLTSPDVTPATDTFTSSVYGAIGFIINVGAAGGTINTITLQDLDSAATTDGSPIQ